MNDTSVRRTYWNLNCVILWCSAEIAWKHSIIMCAWWRSEESPNRPPFNFMLAANSIIHMIYFNRIRMKAQTFWRTKEIALIRISGVYSENLTHWINFTSSATSSFKMLWNRLTCCLAWIHHRVRVCKGSITENKTNLSHSRISFGNWRERIGKTITLVMRCNDQSGINNLIYFDIHFVREHFNCSMDDLVFRCAFSSCSSLHFILVSFKSA